MLCGLFIILLNGLLDLFGQAENRADFRESRKALQLRFRPYVQGTSQGDHQFVANDFNRNHIVFFRNTFGDGSHGLGIDFRVLERHVADLVLFGERFVKKKFRNITFSYKDLAGKFLGFALLIQGVLELFPGNELFLD